MDKKICEIVLAWQGKPYISPKNNKPLVCAPGVVVIVAFSIDIVMDVAVVEASAKKGGNKIKKIS